MRLDFQAKEGEAMPAIVEFPQVVLKALSEFAHIFANEPQRKHFAEYLTGLMIAQNKTVTGINSEFAQTTDQSVKITIASGLAHLIEDYAHAVEGFGRRQRCFCCASALCF